ncbi:MAG TPA: putative peptidoglycan glycosyltransferase FtsW [Thermoanaerobaculia bacterium]|jgi:cell division protein FtsW
MAQKLVHDRVLFTTVLLLAGLGLVMVFSASAVMAKGRGFALNPFFVKQCLAAAIGLAAMFAVMHADYRWLRRPAVVYALLLGALVLLVAVLFAPTLNNSRRWFFVGGVSVQPSELGKLALVAFVAYQVERKKDRLSSYGFLIPASFATALMATLVLMGGDLGTAVLLCLPPLVMIVLAGVSWRFLLVGAGMLLPILGVSVLLVPYRLRRWLAFFDPESDPLGSGFQVLQSLIAVGSGGLFGLGPGNSVQKLYFLPSPHADFIFAIIAEELGLLGALGLLALFAVLLWRGVLAGFQAPDDLGRYLAWGFTSLLVVQALLHASVALALVPTTGIPLPFISHGGSSLVTTLVACGVILNVSQHRLTRHPLEASWLTS